MKETPLTIYVAGSREAYLQWRNNFVGKLKPKTRSVLREDFGGFHLAHVTNDFQVLGLRKSDHNDCVILPDADPDLVKALRQRGFKPSSREVPTDAANMRRSAEPPLRLTADRRRVLFETVQRMRD